MGSEEWPKPFSVSRRGLGMREEPNGEERQALARRGNSEETNEGRDNGWGFPKWDRREAWRERKPIISLPICSLLSHLLTISSWFCGEERWEKEQIEKWIEKCVSERGDRTHTSHSLLSLPFLSSLPFLFLCHRRSWPRDKTQKGKGRELRKCPWDVEMGLASRLFPSSHVSSLHHVMHPLFLP